jgi:putative DNA primase/helicase
VAQAVQRLGAMLARKGAHPLFTIIPSGDGRKMGLDDYFVSGGSVESLVLASGAELPAHIASEEIRYECSDLGNAYRFRDYCADSARYCSEIGRWLLYKGGVWRFDKTDEVYEIAFEVVKALFDECKGLRGDDLGIMIRHAKTSQNQARIKAMVDLAAKLPGMKVGVDELDANLMVINFSNCAFDLESMDLVDEEERRSLYCTKSTGYALDIGATCPVFERYLKETVPDLDQRRFVLQFMGLCLTGRMDHKSFMFAFGPPDTGKSTFTWILAEILGDYAKSADKSAFAMRQDSNAPAPEIAAMRGARLVYVSETDSKRWSTALLKQITGGDKITCRDLYKSTFEFQPQCKILIQGNFLPGADHDDDAFWRRARVVPFVQEVKRKDPALREKLYAERAGILMMAIIKGLVDERENGMVYPEGMKAAADEWRDEMDPVLLFIEERLVVGEDRKIGCVQLWDEYKNFAGKHTNSLGTRRFMKNLDSKGYARFRDWQNGGVWTWRGIGLANVHGGGSWS